MGRCSYSSHVIFTLIHLSDVATNLEVGRDSELTARPSDSQYEPIRTFPLCYARELETFGFCGCEQWLGQ